VVKAPEGPVGLVADLDFVSSVHPDKRAAPRTFKATKAVRARGIGKSLRKTQLRKE